MVMNQFYSYGIRWLWIIFIQMVLGFKRCSPSWLSSHLVFYLWTQSLFFFPSNTNDIGKGKFEHRISSAYITTLIFVLVALPSFAHFHLFLYISFPLYFFYLFLSYFIYATSFSLLFYPSFTYFSLLPIFL